MSRHNLNNNPVISMNIVIGNRTEIVNVSKIIFDDLIKVPSNWEHVYELDIADETISLTDEDFISVCNHIGDMFIDFNTELQKEAINKNVFLHLAKFVDKYIVPNASNEASISRVYRYISKCDMSFPLDTTIDIFPDTHVEYKCKDYRFHTQNYTVGIEEYSSYVPTGTLKDAYVIYKICSMGNYSALSDMKWFKSLAVLFTYFGIDHIVKMVRSRKRVGAKPIICSDEEWPKAKASYYEDECEEDPRESVRRYEPKKKLNETSSIDSDGKYIPSDFECPPYDEHKVYKKIMLIMDDLRPENEAVFKLLHVLLKNHIRGIVLPEKEHLIDSMNNLGNYL